MAILIKNTSMTQAQKEKAFEVVGAYMSQSKESVTTVDSYNTRSAQIIVKVTTPTGTYCAIIGARGKVIDCGWL